MASPGIDPVHVVVDGGLDDALALAVLVGLGVPLSQVVATEGSVDLVTTATATRRLMATLGSAVPVRLGSDRGLVTAYPEGRDPFHGPDAFGGQVGSLAPANSPGAPARDPGGTVFCGTDSGGTGFCGTGFCGTVFCGGALTCVAKALRDGDPISEVVWMGGAVAAGGNMTASAEFNAWMDPVATDIVLTSGASVLMVPLDVTERFEWSARELDSLRTAGRVGTLLADAIAFAWERDGVFIPHDAVTAIALTSRQLFRWTARHVRCETKGELTSGETVVDRRPWGQQGSVLVAEEADVAEVSARILAAVASLG
jgi:inosine-uridine nucleoside N-ribohydrolase